MAANTRRTVLTSFQLATMGSGVNIGCMDAKNVALTVLGKTLHADFIVIMQGVRRDTIF